MAKHKSIKEVVRMTTRGLHKAGVMDAKTMRKFDALCRPKAKKR